MDISGFFYFGGFNNFIKFYKIINFGLLHHQFNGRRPIHIDGKRFL